MLDLKGFATEELQAIVPKLKGMITEEGKVNEELMTIFNESDKDENGFLDKSELKGLLHSFFTKMHITLVLNDELVDQAFVSIDTNHDSKIQTDEFAHFVNAQVKKLLPYLQMELKKRAES